jgi:quinol monooxygenase YgiN
MSKSDEIIVLARWKASERTLAEILQHIPELKKQTLGEPGCRGYQVFRQLEDPTDLLLIERYANQAAQDAHRNSKHYQELVLGRIIPLLEGRSVELLEERA